MRPPRYLGTYNGCPVFRVDSPGALARVWRSPRWVDSYPGRPFRPGLRIEVDGLCMRVPEGLAGLKGAELDAACSSPRLARVLRALDARAPLGG